MTRQAEQQKAYQWFHDNLPEVVAFLKTALKTQQKRAAKKE